MTPLEHIAEERPMLTDEECDQLEKFFDEGAAKFDPLDAYWIDGADHGNDYCRKCAEIECAKEAARFRRLPKAKKAKLDHPSLGGGYRVEHDGTPFCESCSALLDGSLTNYACESELEHFGNYGFDMDDEDRRAMSEVIRARGWRPYDFPHYTDWERKKEAEYFRGLHALGRNILNRLQRAQAATEGQG